MRSRIMEEELLVYPSMDGAVQMDKLRSPAVCASTLQQSLITPDPSAMMTSQVGSNAMVMAPTVCSSGSGRGFSSMYSTQGMLWVSSTSLTGDQAAAFVFTSQIINGLRALSAFARQAMA